ncbi:MAG: class I SAM-dependent methyltransferase [Sphingomonas sp.]
MIAIDTFRGSPEHQPGAAYFDPSTLAVDGTVDTLPLFLANLRRFRLEARVEVWRSDSAAAAARMTEPVALLFLDADHRYDCICRDLEAWLPRLAPTGIIVLHDIGDWPGPTRAAADLLERGFCREAQSGTALALRTPS